MRAGDDAEVVHRWFESCHRLGLALVPATTMGEQLHAAYTEPHRSYHNLGHIRHVLDLAATLRMDQRLRPIVELALWFHDVVYDPTRSDNETMSAELARDWMNEQGLDGADHVHSLIAMTASHEGVDRRDRGAAVVHDVDLAILGSAPQEYGRYLRAVRDEYGWLDDEAFRLGRRRVVERFLGADHLYLTPELTPVLDLQARANLSTELATLG